jgi:hypothetical protein
MMDKVNSIRTALSMGLTRGEAADLLISNGVSREDAFLVLSAAIVLNRPYTYVAQATQNRSESCVQILQVTSSV